MMDESRGRDAALCEAVGVDPAQVIAVEWRASHPKTAYITILDGAAPDERHVEEHPVPEGWQR